MTKASSTKLTGALAFAVMLAASCSNSDDSKTAICVVDGGGNGGSAGAAGSDAGAPLTDPQIAGVMIDANAGEVHAADIANGRTKTASVRTFAAMMITDHTAANHTLDMVLDAQNLTAADSATRLALATQAQQTLNDLWAVPQPGFDAAYMKSQVTMHEMVLTQLDDVLIPQATNAAVKATLQAARTVVAMHLADAQAILATLASDGGVADGAADGATD